MIAAVILAGGMARRAGGPKVVWPVSGAPSVRLCALAALNCRGISETIVVTGFYEDEVRAALEGLPIAIVHNSLFAKGQAESVKAGFKAVSENARAAIFMVADQPLIRPELLSALIDLWKQGPAKIVVPVFQGRRRSPVLFDLSRFRGDLMALEGDFGARGLIDRHFTETAFYESPGPEEMFWDFDHKGDYDKIKALGGEDQAE